MEAIGCGCPVIVGDVAGIHDLLGDAHADVCVNPEDTASLAAAIVNALDNPEQSHHSAQVIRDAAAEHVDWQHIADGYARLLQECVGTARCTGELPAGNRP
jgi:glycosyltransferase involved in cell wall biosynthesis